MPLARTSRVSRNHLPVLRVERGLDPLGQVRGAADAPIMEEQDPRLLAGHVLMNGHDVDAGAPQGLEHSLELGLQHCEVSVDDRLVVAPGEGGPRVDAHRAAHRLAVHPGLAADGDLVDAILELAARAEDCVDLLRVERTLRRIDVPSKHLALAAARLLDLGEDLADGGGELRLIAHAADVHEHHLRGVPEEVVVQSGHLEVVVECDAHHRVHLIFEKDNVTHDDRVLAGLLEGGPRRKPHRRRERDAGRGYREVAPRHGDLDDDLLLAECPLRPRELLDLRHVERRLCRRCEGCRAGPGESCKYDYEQTFSHLALPSGARAGRRFTSSHWMFWKNASTYLGAAPPQSMW